MAVAETAEGGRELYTWGCGYSGTLGHGDVNNKLVPTLVEGPLQGRRVVSVAAGGYHSMAVVETAEGGRELFTWGFGAEGRLGHGNHRVQKRPKLVNRRCLVGAREWAGGTEPEASGAPLVDASIMQRDALNAFAEERVREAERRLLGNTARDMSDEELSTLRDKVAAGLRRFDLEMARRRCIESLAEEATADNASPFRSFICPITLEVMEHPVVASDGYSYERAALETHIAGRPTFQSPITNAEFPSEPLIPNNNLRSDIQNRLDQMARDEVDGCEAAGVARQRRRRN